MRVELMTPSLPRKCSTTELLRRFCERCCPFVCLFERETSLEPATFSLEGWRSANWATPALLCKWEVMDSNHRSRSKRFTVSRNWPLYELPKISLIVPAMMQALSWSRRRDSNPRPADYKSAALANWATPAFYCLNVVICRRTSVKNFVSPISKPLCFFDDTKLYTLFGTTKFFCNFFSTFFQKLHLLLFALEQLDTQSL